MRTCSLFQEICVNLCTCKLVVHRCKETLQPEELIIMSYFPSIKHGLSLLFFNLVKFLQWGISSEISWEAIDMIIMIFIFITAKNSLVNFNHCVWESFKNIPFLTLCIVMIRKIARNSNEYLFRSTFPLAFTWIHEKVTVLQVIEYMLSANIHNI